MGLDVYLYRYEDYEDTCKREDEYLHLSDERWKAAGNYEKLSDAAKAELRAEDRREAERLSLSQWGEDELRKHKIEIDSPIDPSHMFKRGYFRSSYNEGGIDRVLHRLLGSGGLAEIFGVTGDEYHVRPDWLGAREKARALAAALEDYARSCDVDVMRVSHNIFVNPKELPSDGGEALKVFNGIRKLHGDRDYGGCDGEVRLAHPVTAVAFIPGLDALNAPCTYVVYKRTADDSLDWYVKALRIVADTCDWVSAKAIGPNGTRSNEIDQYWLHWSG